jgi:hypothetical protein
VVPLRNTAEGTNPSIEGMPPVSCPACMAASKGAKDRPTCIA